METSKDPTSKDPTSKDPTQAVKVAVFQEGRKILSEGEENSLFHVILSGQVVLSRNGKNIRALREQDIFGLESLLLKRPFHYSARAAQECRIASYGPQTLDHLIHESPRMIQNVLISILQQLNQTTLNMLDQPLDFLVDRERIRFLKDGEIIVEDTSCGTDIYRLISTEGGLQVSAEGREIRLISKPGEFFGFPGPGPSACVKSVGESALETYSTDDLDIIIRDYPESACLILRSLMNALRDRSDV